MFVIMKDEYVCQKEKRVSVSEGKTDLFVRSKGGFVGQKERRISLSEGKNGFVCQK